MPQNQYVFLLIFFGKKTKQFRPQVRALMQDDKTNVFSQDLNILCLMPLF